MTVSFLSLKKRKKIKRVTGDLFRKKKKLDIMKKKIEITSQHFISNKINKVKNSTIAKNCF